MVNWSQQTSGRYCPDILQPRDQFLVWAREWGTNVNTDIGDFVDTDPGGADGFPLAEIDARTGRLLVHAAGLSATTQSSNPRGQTFLLPDWSTGPAIFPNSLNPDVRSVVLYACLGSQDTRLFNLNTLWATPVDVDCAGLIIGGFDLVGDAGAENFALVELFPAAPNEFQPAAPPDMLIGQKGVGVSLWPVSTPPAAATWTVNPYWTGGDLYIRVIMAWTAKTNDTETNLAISTDGISWTSVANETFPDSVVRRVGLTSRNNGWGSLNWARLYQPTDPRTDTELEEAYGPFVSTAAGILAPTGGRLYE